MLLSRRKGAFTSSRVAAMARNLFSPAASAAAAASAGSANVVVIGGGAAGMAAALEASSKIGSEGTVYILESMPKVGGNSAKASSGMNGCYTEIQAAHEITDSLGVFKEDTLRMAKGLANPALVEKLVDESASAISFVSSLGLPLHDAIQLGGHSAARTHRLQGQPIGAVLMKTLAAAAASQPNIKLVTGAVVSRLTHCEENHSEGTRRRVTGVVYTEQTPGEEGQEHGEEEGEEVELPAGAVVLASGGAACDVSPDGLMQQYAPHLVGKATSSGAQATGKGIKLAKALGVELVNMERVQLHPTGFVDPSQPGSTSKFLAPEALRGSGGVLLNQQGHRFANELGSRSYLTDCIHQNCLPCETDLSTGKPQTVAYMILNQQAVDKFGPGPMGFYIHKGLFREFAGLEAACEALDLPLKNVEGTFRDYAAAASGKTKDPFGKVTFPVLFSDDAASEEGRGKVFAAQITPVIHYSLGGIKIDTQCRALLTEEEGGQPLPGLFAAGECTGGVHGFDRLGGNSLLECVVFGRTAGREAAASVISSSSSS